MARGFAGGLKYFCTLGPRAGVWTPADWNADVKQSKNCSKRWLGKVNHQKPFCQSCPFYRPGEAYDPYF